MNVAPASRIRAAANHMPRIRGRLGLCLLACAVVAALLPSAASAKTAEQLKSELDNLKQQTHEAGDAFDRAFWKLDETETRISKVDKKVAKTKVQLGKAQVVLQRHVAASYRRGNLDFVEFLVSSQSFEDLVTRMDFVRRVGESDAQVISDVKALRHRLTLQRADLTSEKRTATKDLASLQAERDRLQSRLKEKQADFLRVKAELDAVRGGPNRPDGQMATPGPNGMVFPVVGSYYYSDTWGASRSGGRRRHQGTDIMAPRGTPVVAVLSGTVRSSNHGLGGKAIWLTARNGWQFYYAHLDGWAVRSGQVKAGQVIGYVGNTGNAAGGATHLHFQIEPHGSPVNPYPYLRAME